MLPHVHPIIPVLRPEPFDDPGWLFDLKYDGFRALAYLQDGHCRLISRNANVMRRFAGLGEQIAASFNMSAAIFDGEIVAADDEGRPQFYELLRHEGQPTYVAFDLIWLDGTDLRPLPLTERRRRLRRLLSKKSAIVSEVLSITGKGHKLFDLVRSHDLEGMVAKRLQDSYGSRVQWLKIKNRDYSQAEGRRELFDSRRFNGSTTVRLDGKKPRV